jgi:hypothetical protein
MSAAPRRDRCRQIQTLFRLLRATVWAAPRNVPRFHRRLLPPRRLKATIGFAFRRDTPSLLMFEPAGWSR